MIEPLRERLRLVTIDRRRVVTAVVVIGFAAGTVALAAPGLFAGSRPKPTAAPATAAPVLTVAQPVVPASRLTPSGPAPARLTIPALGVNAAIESVAATKDNHLGLPLHDANAGWYEAGVRPGQAGDAVIEAHADRPMSPSVFWRLGELRQGDVVRVGFANGSSATFRVYHRAAYPWDQAPVELFATTGPARLSLITCGGTWDNGRYAKRVIIDTVRVA